MFLRLVCQVSRPPPASLSGHAGPNDVDQDAQNFARFPHVVFLAVDGQNEPAEFEKTPVRPAGDAAVHRRLTYAIALVKLAEADHGRSTLAEAPNEVLSFGFHHGDERAPQVIIFSGPGK